MRSNMAHDSIIVTNHFTKRAPGEHLSPRLLSLVLTGSGVP